VAILLLLSKRAIIAHNKLIDSQRYKRIPFTLTFHPHNQAVKSIILKNFKLLQNDPDTGRIFSQPALILFKHDKNIANFLVTSVFQTSEQPGTFKDVRANCFCASLLRTQIHTPRHTRARTLSNKKLNNHRQRAIAIALPGFFYIFLHF